MKSLSSTDGNTWRGLVCAEAKGEFFVLQFSCSLAIFKKIEINNFEIFLLIFNLFGLFGQIILPLQSYIFYSCLFHLEIKAKFWIKSRCSVF